jgi:hypothetical protein
MEAHHTVCSSPISVGEQLSLNAHNGHQTPCATIPKCAQRAPNTLCDYSGAMEYGARVSALLQYSSQSLPLTRAEFVAHPQLQAIEREQAAALFPGARDANAALSGLLLLLGGWEQSHELSQNNASPEGSYWHAIAHRIEPDSSNAGYWFRRVGRHPIFSELHNCASTILAQQNPGGWKLQAVWDPFGFVNWCEEARLDPASEHKPVAMAIQQAEWRLLFDWCATVSSR